MVLKSRKCKACGKSTENKKYCSCSNRGKNNPAYGKSGSLNSNWKGDDAGYAAIHYYMSKQIHKPSDDKCPGCHRKVRLLLCNISPIINKKTYNRDPKNWYWACDKCHMGSDGRLSATIERMSLLDKTGKENPRYKHGLRCEVGLEDVERKKRMRDYMRLRRAVKKEIEK
jgi:hypothetical protein